MGEHTICNKIVGTGGIGIGMLFHSLKMETLGRNESRPVLLSKAKDYCKQHIVLHYSTVLTQGSTRVIPIGFVGNDAPGHDLLAEMSMEGMDVRYVGVSENEATMFSVCLQYPDKQSCNFTATNNASRLVTAEYICNCLDQISIDENTIVAAIPEVPIESRFAMLKFGKEKKAFTVLSVASSEADDFRKYQEFSNCDLLALNEDEAYAILDRRLEGKDMVLELYLLLCNQNPNIELLVTMGERGAYTVANGYIEFIPSLPVNVINTTGAGDAFLGGTLAGLAKGLHLQKHRNDSRFGETNIESAAELGALCAGMAVEVEDSIAFHVTRDSIKSKILENHWGVDTWFVD